MTFGLIGLSVPDAELLAAFSGVFDHVLREEGLSHEDALHADGGLVFGWGALATTVEYLEDGEVSFEPSLVAELAHQRSGSGVEGGDNSSLVNLEHVN